MVEVERFSDLRIMQVETLMPDRPKVRFQTKKDTGVYAVRRRSRFASGTRLFIKRGFASEPETVLLRKKDLTSLKKAKLESAKGKGPIPGQKGPRETFKRDTGTTEGVGGVFSQ